MRIKYQGRTSSPYIPKKSNREFVTFLDRTTSTFPLWTRISWGLLCCSWWVAKLCSLVLWRRSGGPFEGCDLEFPPLTPQPDCVRWFERTLCPWPWEWPCDCDGGFFAESYCREKTSKIVPRLRKSRDVQQYIQIIRVPLSPFAGSSDEFPCLSGKPDLTASHFWSSQFPRFFSMNPSPSRVLHTLKPTPSLSVPA